MLPCRSLVCCCLLAYRLLFCSLFSGSYVAPHWRNSAIGNARWAGVKVRDLLEACGMDVDAVALRKKTTNGMQLVNFVAEDVDETGTPCE